MSMTLNPVNEAAFQKAVQSLETLNRAAVFHPTGTGKSCIAWKVVEAHPQTTFFWLVAGAQRLALRQAELTRYNGISCTLAHPLRRFAPAPPKGELLTKS